MVLPDTLDLGQRSTYEGWGHAYTLFRPNPVNALADRIHPCSLSRVKCDKSYDAYEESAKRNPQEKREG
jgi:hypothetical protein